MSRSTNVRKLRERIAEVSELRDAVLEYASEHSTILDLIEPGHRASAENLLHYLALRKRDLRPLQLSLSHLGLSSLGRLEAHVEVTLRAVLFALHCLAGTSGGQASLKAREEEFEKGMSLLRKHTEEILGPPPPGRATQIMVTMPGFAVENRDLIPDLLKAGMNQMRINCAHDSCEDWKKMVECLREPQSASEERCRVVFDLAGPKLRTGPVAPEPAVFRWKPLRNLFGQTVKPARVRFIPAPFDTGYLPDVASGIPLERKDFELLQPGRRIHLSDTRDRRLELEIVEKDGDSVFAECCRTGYIAPGTVLEVIEGSHHLGELLVAPFRPAENNISLLAGDRLTLLRGNLPGQQVKNDESEWSSRSPTISCDFDSLFTDCRPGEPILFDDGLIAGVIREVRSDHIDIDILHTAKHPAKLKAEKGINLPDTMLRVPALTDKDIADLESIAGLADMVSLSFVRSQDDVVALIGELNRIGAKDVGIVLKIETRSAFESLPAILLAALRHPPVAVMIARGDLGVELGFERMAEVQEEILWICEAAHVPVIWATQVLESLAKNGLVTRAEVTDAAMSGRAECVMLNKGPYIVQAVETLSDILTRMQDHQVKKSSQMRPLSIAGVRAIGD